MKWDRTTVKAVVIVFLTVIATSFFVKWTFDHDGETVTLFGDDSPSAGTTPMPGTPSATVPSGDTDPESGLPWVLEDELPVEAQATLALIDRGGPFPFPGKDGFAAKLQPLGTGQMAESVRLTIGYDGPTDGPSTLIAKLPSRDERSRATGRVVDRELCRVGNGGECALAGAASLDLGDDRNALSAEGGHRVQRGHLTFGLCLDVSEWDLLHPDREVGSDAVEDFIQDAHASPRFGSADQPNPEYLRTSLANY